MTTNQFTYHGSVSIPLITDATLQLNVAPNFSPTWSSTWDLRSLLRQQPIHWTEQSVPNSLKNITLPQFITSNQWQRSGLSKLTTFVTVNGQQANGSNIHGIGVPGYTKYSLTDDQGIVFSETIAIAGYSSNDARPWSNGINKNINQYKPTFRMPVSAYFENTMTSNYPDAYHVNYSVVINVLASTSCTGAALDTPFCVDVCTANPEARTKCRNSYLEYCTPTVLASSQNCQNFIEAEIQNEGPIPSLDTALRSYCSQKYRGFGDLNVSTNAIDKELCACHMPDEQYQNLEKQIAGDFPEILSFYPQIDLCFFPLCVSSRYPAAPIPKGGCKIPQCLNIAAFNNEGEFTGNVNITQSCQINSGGNNTLLILVAVLVAIIILAIILYILFR